MTATIDKITTIGSAARPWADQQAAAVSAPTENVAAKKPTSIPIATTKGDGIVPDNTVELSWDDVVDIVNPLHQLPVVGDVYRGITGEKISGVARVMGGFLYGGISGGFVAAMTAAYAEANTDQSPGEQVVAALFGTDTQAAPGAPQQAAPVMLADAPDMTNDAPTTVAELKQTEAEEFKIAETDVPAADTALLARAETPVAKIAEEAAPVGNPSPFSVVDAAPLREKFNRKNASNLNSAMNPMLAQFGNVTNAQNLQTTQAAQTAATRNDNLQLLQGVADLPPVTPEGSAALADAMSANTQRRNPLPGNLVQDMMMQALDKYQSMSRVAGSEAEDTAPAN